MRRIIVLALALLTVSRAPARADGFSFDPAFTPADFGELAQVVADVVAFPSVAPASPSGVSGFEVLGLAGGPRIDTGAHWWAHGVDGTTVAGTLLGPRAIARKGLPLHLDIGGQVGKVLAERFVGAELRWALVEGGLTPAVALRGSYSWLDRAAIDLNVTEVQLIVSQSFVLATPYAAVGYRRVAASAFFGDPAPRTHSFSSQGATGAAGVRLALLPFRLVAEVRQGKKLGYFVGLGIGL